MKKYNITVNGNHYEVEVEEVGATASTIAPVISTNTTAPTAPKASTPAPTTAPAPAAGTTPVTAPMPGTILEIKTTVGASVKRGDTLFVLEAMKMENEIPAPCDGTVLSIDVAKGAAVANAAILASLK